MGARKPKKIEEASEIAEKKISREAVAPQVKAEKKSSAGKSDLKKKRGKRYGEVKKKVAESALPLSEALKKVKDLSYASFDASVDAHFRLGIDAKNQEQQIRTFVSLPHGTGKKVKVLVFAEEALAKKSQTAGADVLGDEKLIEEIAKGKVPNVDAIIATPSWMPKIAKAARILGPKGLMPTPKTGTVTNEPDKAVEEIKKGKVELKTGEQPAIHVSIGKVSFADEKLSENFKAVVEGLNRARPGKVKGVYLQAAYLAPTMGPSVKVSLESL